ncbi:4-galactosyl-N-acetylglucosaminide 3-alpha-L-fucosyltransferase FUT6-like isoform X1 [Styela clava]
MRTIFLLRSRQRTKCIGFAFIFFIVYVYMFLWTSQELQPQISDVEAVHKQNIIDISGNIRSPVQDPVLKDENVTFQVHPEDPAGYFVGLHHSNFEKIVNPPGHKPTILIWHPPFGSKTNYLANPEVCGGDVDCLITYDRNLLNDSGAIVFHFGGARREAMPPFRKPEQLYLWWTGEKNHGSQLTEFDNFFNLTFTYRSDSGIYAPYGSTNLILQELREANDLDLEALLEKKRKSGKIAAWAVSNCGVHRRMDLAKSIMNKGLQVDTFGRCFGGRQIGAGTYSASFYEALSSYKFYFSFENGYHCKDYMTEKFWFNGLRSGAVPIVHGAKKEDVAAVAPKNSFIHVEDFDNVDELVKYLQYLSNNETAYRRHLEWRTWAAHPELIEERLKPHNRDNDLRSFCKLCRILQEEEEADRQGKKRRQMIVPSMNEYWWKMENPECLNG